MKHALLYAAVMAAANLSAAEAADYLDTIVVTASRTPQALASASSAIVGRVVLFMASGPCGKATA